MDASLNQILMEWKKDVFSGQTEGTRECSVKTLRSLPFETLRIGVV